MFRKKTAVIWLLMASLSALGCPGKASYNDGSAEVRGNWLVDFGADQGVLRLHEGQILALCYGSGVQLGSYQVKQGRMTMTMDFLDGAGEHSFVGEVEAIGDNGFKLGLATMAPGAALSFTEYTGDCSEVTGN